ncbi:MAG: hypothetical protein PHU31_04175 [Anaerotignum sp.]|nr:hypothetical protein [Anaerotignum sp.]
MQHVLLKMPNGEIKIEDNSTHIGKKRVAKLCNEGAVSAGTIESDLRPNQLKCGISHGVIELYEAEYAKLWSLRRLLTNCKRGGRNTNAKSTQGYNIL